MLLPENQPLEGERRFSSPSEPTEQMMSVEDVQRVLHRSRATIYRYANTDPKGIHLNLPYDPRYLNPEHRSSPRQPLQFHPVEVARYAKEILQLRDVNVEVVEIRSETDLLLREILEELRLIRTVLEQEKGASDPR